MVVESATSMAGGPARPPDPVRPWARWSFRVAVTVEAALAFGQPVWAGGFLAGNYDLLAVHRDFGRYTGAAAIVALVVAILLWRPGRGPGWPAAVCAALLGAVVAQIALGFTRVLAIHIPLGVTIIAATAFLLVWAWCPARGRGVRR